MRRTDILSKELVQKFQALGITGFHGLPTKGPRKGHKDVPRFLDMLDRFEIVHPKYGRKNKRQILSPR